jgi:uroporphyrinogen-III synthase
LTGSINIAITREEIEKDDVPQQDNIDACSRLKKNLNILPLPTIVTAPIYSKDTSSSLKKIESGFYDYYVFLSAHSVDFFFALLEKEKRSHTILQNIKKSNSTNTNFIAIGPKTKQAIERHGLRADLATPHNKAKYSLNGITEFLDQLDKGTAKEKTKILMPRSSESQKSNNGITKTFRNLVLDQVFFYETREYNKIGESDQWDKFKRLTHHKELGYIIFTSPSAARAFFKTVTDSANNILPDSLKQQAPSLSDIKNGQQLMDSLGIKSIVSLGPKTSEELKKRNIVFIEPQEHTVFGALECLLDQI